MKSVIKTLGTIVILGTVAMASNVTDSILTVSSSTLTVEGLNATNENILITSTDTSWYCDPIERLMGFCK